MKDKALYCSVCECLLDGDEWCSVNHNDSLCCLKCCKENGPEVAKNKTGRYDVHGCGFVRVGKASA